MAFPAVFDACPLLFTEGAVIERLKRSSRIELDPDVLHAGWIYSPETRAVLGGIYRQYIEIVRQRGVPMISFTPTWRANPERIRRAALQHRDVNGDCARFLADLRDEYGAYASSVFIGGLMGCRGDAYRASEALSEDEAFEFHADQAAALAGAGVDFLFAATLPAASEASGLARSMARTGLAYGLGFVVRADGALLDGTSLHDAIAHIDATASPRPLFYMVNCVHPSILLQALQSPANRTDLIRARLAGIQANASSKSPDELDDAPEMACEDLGAWADGMAALHTRYRLKVLGGCCGTDERHIQALVDRVP